MAVRQQALRQEHTDLSKTERMLDMLIQECTLQLKHLTEDETNQRYPFLGARCKEDAHVLYLLLGTVPLLWVTFPGLLLSFRVCTLCWVLEVKSQCYVSEKVSS